MITYLPLSYEDREVQRYQDEMRAITKQSREDRFTAKASFAALLRDPDLAAERVSWIFAGHYGYGALVTAQRIASNPRMNRIAGVSQILAAVECQCPQREAIAAWKSLTPAEQTAVNAAIAATIEAACQGG